MAKLYVNSALPFSTNPHHQRQLQLFSLVSRLCAPRTHLAQDRVCRLIVDSRLPWVVEPIDGNTSWLYLPEPVNVHKLADCLVMTAD
jgi:hypothetical protein